MISLGIVAALGAAACGTSVQHGASNAGAQKSKTAKIAIVPAGPHPYFAPMPKGIKQAKGDFNLTNITYQVPATWSLSDQNKTIESLVSQGYNAFAMFPGDANGSNATISELASHGIPTVTIGGCTRSPTKAKFCLATDVKKEAYQAAKQLIKAIGGKGKIVHFTSNLTDPNTKPREQGVARAVRETHGKVKLVQTIAGTDSPDKAGPAVRSLLAARGNKIDGIMSTAYTDSVALAKELMQSNPHHIKVIGIDADPTVIKGIKKDAVTATIDQNPYGQAYIATYALNQMVSHGCRMKDKSSPHIDSGTIVVTKRNADHYLDNLRALTKKIQSTFKQKYLTCPSS
ncbi:MAG: sugar ABC transporter substrate-binding protein [Nocardioidaceae bacterium]